MDALRQMTRAVLTADHLSEGQKVSTLTTLLDPHRLTQQAPPIPPASLVTVLTADLAGCNIQIARMVYCILMKKWLCAEGLEDGGVVESVRISVRRALDTLLHAQAQPLHTRVTEQTAADEILASSDWNRVQALILLSCVVLESMETSPSMTELTDVLYPSKGAAGITAVITDVLACCQLQARLPDEIPVDIRHALAVILYSILSYSTASSTNVRMSLARHPVDADYVLSLCLHWLASPGFASDGERQARYAHTLVTVIPACWSYATVVSGREAAILKTLQLLFVITADEARQARDVANLSRVLQAAPLSFIPKVMPGITASWTIPELAMSRLCTWPLTAHIVQWFKAFFLGLQASRRLPLLARLLTRCTPLVVKQVLSPRVASLWPHAIDLFQFMLFGHDHSPVLFHQHLNSVLRLLKTMSTLIKTSASSGAGHEANHLLRARFDTLHALVHILVSRFPGYPMLYKCIEETLQETVSGGEKPAQDVVDAVTRLYTSFSLKRALQAAQDSKVRNAVTDTLVVSALRDQRMPGYPVGIVNEGNTCFKNSVIQSLFHSPIFRHCVLNCGDAGAATQNVTHDLQQVFSFLAMSERRAIRVNTAFACMSLFTDGRQHDASEFIRMLLDAAYEETRVPSRCSGERGRDSHQGDATALVQTLPQHGPVYQAFAGVMAQRISCTMCQAISSSVSYFLDLSLPIVSPSAPELPSSQPPSVESCLQSYLSPEQMNDKHNLYRCDSAECQGLEREAVRRVCIEHAPRVLMLALNRFTYNAVQQRKDKVNTRVDISLHLTLPTTSGPAHYILMSAVVHAGNSAESGHYYTLVRIPTSTPGNSGDIWYECNDSTVTRLPSISTSEEWNSAVYSNSSSTPYLLVYEQIDQASPPHPSAQVCHAGEKERVPTTLLQAVLHDNTTAINERRDASKEEEAHAQFIQQDHQGD